MARKKSWLYYIDWIAVVLTMIGALNWIPTYYNYNLVEMLTDAINIQILNGIVYWLVGLSVVYTIIRASIGKFMK
jgi:uncharacterized membrane protein YuzA (DUF378 family)